MNLEKKNKRQSKASESNVQPENKIFFFCLNVIDMQWGKVCIRLFSFKFLQNRCNVPVQFSSLYREKQCSIFMKYAAMDENTQAT